MSSAAIQNVSKALGYDVAETMLSEGFSLAAVYALASMQAEASDLDSESPETCRTVLATIPVGR